MEPHTIGTDIGKQSSIWLGSTCAGRSNLTDSRHLDEIFFDTL